jgi:hypothetical protein
MCVAVIHTHTYRALLRSSGTARCSHNGAAACRVVLCRPGSVGGVNGSTGGSGQPEQQATSSNTASAAADDDPPSDSSDQAAAAAPRRAGLISSTAAAALRAYRRHQQGPQHLLTDFSPHLWCSCKLFVKPDTSLIASVSAALEKEQQGAAGGLAAAAGLAGGYGQGQGALYRSKSGLPAGAAGRQLRRHFAELTAAFLAPFQRYFDPGASGMVSWLMHKFARWRCHCCTLLPHSHHDTVTKHHAHFHICITGPYMPYVLLLVVSAVPGQLDGDSLLPAVTSRLGTTHSCWQPPIHTKYVQSLLLQFAYMHVKTACRCHVGALSCS